MTDAEKYLLQAKGALASLKSFVADVTVAVEVATSKVETALSLVQGSGSCQCEPRPVAGQCSIHDGVKKTVFNGR